MRYSTIRWITSNQPAFGAIGPSRMDPRTGEILDADILIEGNFMQGFRNTYRRWAGPDAMAQSAFPQLAETPSFLPSDLRCDVQAGMLDGAAFMRTAMLIEGAMMAADVAPGLEREHFGFEHLAMHDGAQWRAMLIDARSRAERGLAAQLPEFRGYDWDPAVIRRAQENIAHVGLEKIVRVSCKPLSLVQKPSHRPLPTGLMVCNPPYGERIGEKERLRAVYRQLGEIMLTQFPGWQAAILTSDLDLGKATGLRSHKRYALYNGAIAVNLLLFDLGKNDLRQTPASPAAIDAPPAVLYRF